MQGETCAAKGVGGPNGSTIKPTMLRGGSFGVSQGKLRTMLLPAEGWKSCILTCFFVRRDAERIRQL